MSSTNSQKKLLAISLSAFSACSAFVLPSNVQALTACAASGTAASLNSECLSTPDRFHLTIHEMGLCTTHPLSGAQNSKTVDLSSCFTSMARSATGVSGDLAGAGSFSLPSASSRPPVATYKYAYIIVGKTFGLRGSYALNNGTTYYSDATGANLSTTGPAVNHSEVLDDFGNGGFDAEWGTDPNNPEVLAGSGKVSALLLNSSFTRSTAANNTVYLFGAFEADPGNEVVITDKTTGVKAELQVTDAGYTVIPFGVGHAKAGQPSEFGSAPFRPVITAE